ncbi:MAG: hypothetical protein ACOH5I_22925 [Oligoflexus sp.]
MGWNWRKSSRPVDGSDQGSGEIFFFLGGQNAQETTKKLQDLCYESLQHEIEGLQLSIGFQGEKGQKPFVLFHWTEAEQILLERRWVWTQAIKHVHALLDFHKITLFIDGSSASLEQRILCEDLYSLLGHGKSKEKKIEQIEVCSLQAYDDAWLKSQENRFQYRLGFADWINESPDTMTSIAIGQHLQAFAAKHGCGFEALDEARLKEQRMNLLLSVGAASESSPPRCYVLTHKIDGKTPPLMLVGKGITFDTGGINVKPFEGHVNAMRNDMGGASMMSHLFMALVEAGYAGPLVLVIPTCENAISGKSMKPGSLIQSRKGHEVFVEHTDAEGRLILADALDYGESLFSPRLTLVAATLTTAALRQFTNYVTPVYFANEQFQTKLQENAKRCGERFIFWEEFRPFHRANRSKFGELTNMGRLPHHANIGGGSNIAAHFLKNFVNGSMIHFDIFASTWNWSGDYPGSGPGATGAPFNSVFSTLMDGGKDLWGYS